LPLRRVYVKHFVTTAMRFLLCVWALMVCCVCRAADEQPWSFRPPQKPPVPVVKGMWWVKDAVDVFVLAGLEAKGLAPAPAARRETLIRRATFDLTGLPPTFEEVERFVRDPANDDAAFAKVVDRLLASPRFGERWARHWLDVVHYADSVGRTMNATFPYAFRYRDWVIDALNADLPYHRFVGAQIAGDLMSASTAAEKSMLAMGTGFLTLSALDLSDRGEQFSMDRIDDQIDVTTRAFLGLTVACARCHNHKTDPIAQRDYYALAGIFISTRTWSGQAGRDGLGANGYVDEDALLRLTGPGPRSAIPSAQDTNTDTMAMQMQAKGYPTRFVFRPERFMGVSEDEEPADCAIRVKGDPYDRGETPARGSVGIPGLPKMPAIPKDSSGRLQLAQWIVAPENPLTARVAVNRIWLHLFGEGIVRTVDDFGITGEAPTNAALLDHLAVRFVQDGWSVKRLIRALMLSSTYRESGAATPEQGKVDPGNTLHWRMTPRRLEIEAIRDSILAVAGELKAERPSGIQVAGFGGKGREAWSRSLMPETAPYRTIYIPVLRDKLPAMHRLFDFPDPAQINGKRDSTTVAAQALFFMNDGFVEEMAGLAAERLLKQEKQAPARVKAAYRLVYTRDPSAEEAKLAAEFIDHFGGGPAAWTRFVQALMASAEFRFVN
jgi:hypothetical protein